MAAQSPIPVQRSLDDLGMALSAVTFCVIDLETTGASAAECAITEIGAVKLRGGECLGTFQTLIDPGCAIPPEITVLTGITDAMVLRAPRIDTVLPSLLEFVGDAVIVGHNVRFDLSFLQAALERSGRPKLTNTAVDTVALARRLVRDEVPNCKLGTLAERLRLDHRPNHRALDDALTTGDLLHLLIERASGLGVMGLDDLLALPRMSGHAQAAKLTLTEDLPREPGVYLFRNARGDVLYVGKATNLRSRVRSYFSSDDRRKIGPMLRETARIDHVVHPHPLSAAVHEIRLIHEHTPPYNRQSKDWGKYVYVRLSLAEAFPRLSIVKEPRDAHSLHLGPLPSRSMAQRVIDAIHTSVPLRRCTSRPGRRGARDAPCTAAQLGVSMCPCTGSITAADYAPVVERAVRGLTTEPDLLLAPLADRITALAADERFEEAADVRDRADALAAALRRQRRYDQLRRAGRVRLELADGSGALLDGGRLVAAWAPGELPLGSTSITADTLADAGTGSEPDPMLFDGPCTMVPLPRELADELGAIASWLDRSAPSVVIDHCEGVLASTLPALPSFTPRGGVGAALR